jgi:hypothetical protein
MTERLDTMTTTAPATELFVTCSDFCGAKITMTGENGKGQHYLKSGAVLQP